MPGPDPDDEVAATLAGWRAIERAATSGPWTTQKAVIAGIGGAYVIEHDELEIALVDCAGDLRPEQELADAAFIATARTAMPLLVAALEAALTHHAEAVIEDMPDPFHYCKTCSGHPAWPCPEVRDITAALTGAQLGEDGT